MAHHLDCRGNMAGTKVWRQFVDLITKTNPDNQNLGLEGTSLWIHVHTLLIKTASDHSQKPMPGTYICCAEDN